MAIHKLLKERFGFDQFRVGQEDVIRDVIAGKDTIAILPTGIGKSLCYQLPAYVLRRYSLNRFTTCRVDGRPSGDYEEEWRKTGGCIKFISHLF